MSIYCLSTMGFMFFLLCLERGLSHVWKGAGAPGSWEHTLPTLLESKCLPPPPPPQAVIFITSFNMMVMMMSKFNDALVHKGRLRQNGTLVWFGTDS